MKHLRLFMAACCTLICTAAMAQQDTVSANFVNQATIGGLKEIKAGKLAVSKGKSLSVKAFGGRMVSDHTTANSKLSKIALKKGYAIPTPAASVTAPDAMLTGSSGSAFDKNYVTMMITDHKATIALFEHAAANAQDADIKAFANSTLPKLRQHLASIQQIATNMGITAQ